MGGMQQCYVVDAANAPWKRSATEGITFACQVLLSGEDGGPEALHFRFDDCPSVYAHMHLTSQFQLLLGGAMDFPRGVKHLEALAIHYTDHNMPYGPFAVSRGHDMLVLHPKAGGIISMANHDARRQINLSGRIFASLACGCGMAAAAGRRALVVQVPDAARLRSGGGRRPGRPRMRRWPCPPRNSGATRWCWKVPLSWMGRKSVRRDSATCAGENAAEPLVTGDNGATRRISDVRPGCAGRWYNRRRTGGGSGRSDGEGDLTEPGREGDRGQGFGSSRIQTPPLRFQVWRTT